MKISRETFNPLNIVIGLLIVVILFEAFGWTSDNIQNSILNENSKFNRKLNYANIRIGDAILNSTYKLEELASNPQTTIQEQRESFSNIEKILMQLSMAGEERLKEIRAIENLTRQGIEQNDIMLEIQESQLNLSKQNREGLLEIKNILQNSSLT